MKPNLLSIGPTRLDLSSGRGVGPRGPFTLSPNETALITCLSEHPGEAVSRDELQVRALGYSPVSLSRAVDAAISRIRTKIEVNPSNPECLQTVYGVGYRLVRDTTTQPTAPGPAPISTLSAIVGRSGELTQLVRLLASPGHVTLYGPPGVGRSTLASELARLEGSALVVRLDREPAAAALLRALGAGHATGSLASAVRSLRGRLVILDDADRADDLDLVLRELVGAGARVLTTSLRPPGVDRASLALQGLSTNESRRLVHQIRDRAGAPPHPRADELADALGGHPGALVYFARRSTVIDPAELVRRLPEGRGSGGIGDALAERTLTWAWSVLGPGERAAVSDLLQFHGAFTLDGAAAVLAADETDTLDRLVELVSRGVLARRGSGFLVYPLLRLAATAAGTRPTTESRQRWRRWISAEAAHLSGEAPSVVIMERTRTQLGDLRRLLDDALEDGDRSAAVDAAWVLARGGERTDPPEQLLALLDRVLPRTGPDPRLLVSRATLLFNLGRRDHGRSDLQTALATAPDHPCRPFAETFWPMASFVLEGRTDPEVLSSVLRSSVERGTDRWWTARAWATLAQFLRLVDRPEEAADACLQAADRWAWVEDTMGEALAWEELALACLDAGRGDDAIAAIERGTALREVNGPWADPPHADLRRGTVLHDLNRLDEADRVLRAGRHRAATAGLPLTAYDAALGWLAIEQERYEEGLELLGEAERTWRASGHAFNTAILAAHRTLGLAGAGRWDEAAREAARSVEPRSGAPMAVRLVHGVHVLVAARRGDALAVQTHQARWAPASSARLAMAAPLDALIRAVAEGRPSPPPPDLPSSITRVVWRTFAP